MTGLPDDDQLDAMGRRAAAQLRTEAGEVAASPAALRQLLARVDAPTHTGDGVEPAAVVPMRPAAPGSRRRHLAVAAVIAMFVAGIGYALVSGLGGSIDIVAPTGTGPGLGGTAPVTSAPGSTTPGTTTPGTTTPGTTTPGSTSPGTSTPQSTTPATSPSSTPVTTRPGVVDPIAGFGEVDTQPPVSLDTVPRLLPGDAFDPARTDRIEYELPDDGFELRQTWVRAGADGVVDAVVTATTERGRNRLGTPIAIDGWPSATQNLTDDGSILLNLNSDGGTVQLGATGLDLADVVAIAASLTVDDEASSWRSDLLAPPDWTSFDQGWRAGAAVRTLVERGDDGVPQTELTTSVGVPIIDLGLPFTTGTGRLVDVAGQPALATSGSGVESLVLLDPGGAALTVATRGTADSLVALATSLTEVDAAAWESASAPADGFDGCLGVIC
jgi:hypothetical protein